MLNIIRFFRGFVNIRVMGDGRERIINIMNNNNISLWNIVSGNNSLEFCMFMSDYKKIMDVRHRAGMEVRVKLVRKNGLPVYLKNILEKPGIVAGVVLLFIISYFLSQYVWLVDVKGNTALSDEEILRVCADMGVKVGVKKKTIDTYNLPQKIAIKLENIAWTSFNVEGSKVTVIVSEAENSEKNNLKVPRNIVASYDGVIKKIEVSAGKKVVDIDRVVTKGELLVSGLVEYGEKIQMVKSEGRIIAETRRDFVETISKNLNVRVENDEIVERRVLEIFGFNIPLFLTDVQNVGTSYKTRKNMCVFGTELPLGYTNRIYRVAENKSMSVSRETAVSLGKYRTATHIRNMPIYDVVHCESSVRETDKEYIVNISLVCLENIAQYVELQVVSD